MRQLMLFLAFAVSAALEALSAGPMEVRESPEGYLLFPGGSIALSAHLPGWRGAKIRPDYALLMDRARGSSGDALRPFKVSGRGGEVLFTGSYEWKVQSKNSLAGKVRIECVTPCEMKCIALSADVGTLPESGLGTKSVTSYRLPADGSSLVVAFPAKTRSYAHDTRKWGGKWNVRFGKTMDGGTFAKGDVVEWEFSISTSAGVPLKFVPARSVTIEKEDGWVALEHKKDVEKGSALDFSGMGLQDAPAGKHGWLKAVGGRFEFERLPGVEQRFYGVNLCFGANYLSHEDADMVVERLVRCGYNSIRLHHHDGAWFESDENREKLDYLVAKAIQKGLYVTTDLYVSRPVKWRDVGVERDGTMPTSLYKAHVGVNESAFADWASHSKRFLDHVNPYTRRAYRDEPGMPLISLVNEGRLVISWDQARKAQDPSVIAAWKEFGGKGNLPRPNWSDRSHPFNRFDEWVNSRVWKKGSSFLRSQGCRALLSNDNDGRWHSEGEGLTPLYDYVDNHFYIDLPQFLGKSWSLPSRRENANPVKKGEPEIFARGWAKNASKPYTVSEWNFAGPGRYRAVGGILTGALASEHDWDGLWRFAYSHSNKTLRDGAGHLGYFDCVTDPLIAASDRASVCLFLRRDAAEGALTTDRDSGSMKIVSQRTCGGFTEGGAVDAGVLSFATFSDARNRSSVPTTLWVSSLDGKPLAKTSRMLLVHLTDAQGEGTCYADEKRQILLKWGKGCLVESASADVALKIASPRGCKVYELDTSGRRVASVPCRVKGGALCFRVSTSGPHGGRMYYEIVR